MDVQRLRKARLVVTLLVMLAFMIFYMLDFLLAIWTESDAMTFILGSGVVVIWIIFSLWRNANPVYWIPILRERRNWKYEIKGEEERKRGPRATLITGSVIFVFCLIGAYLLRDSHVVRENDFYSYSTLYSWRGIFQLIVRDSFGSLYSIVTYLNMRTEDRTLLQMEQKRSEIEQEISTSD